jgi:hypothetical protein
MRTVQIIRYDSQACDNFNDLKKSPTAPGPPTWFHRLCWLRTIGSLIVFSIEDLAVLARVRLLGRFWFCRRLFPYNPVSHGGLL